jgi:hypothetical protein
MKIKTITKTALGAAAVGLLFSLIQLVNLAIRLADSGSPWTRIALVLFSGMKWVYIGLIILFVLIIFRPQSVAKGAWALGFCSVIQLTLAAWNIYLFFSAPEWVEFLGGNIYFVLIELAVPITLLVFSILLVAKNRGMALRLTALLTGLALLITIMYQAFLYGPFDVFTIFDIISAAFVAQWFWVLFLEWKTIQI